MTASEAMQSTESTRPPSAMAILPEVVESSHTEQTVGMAVTGPPKGSCNVPRQTPRDSLTSYGQSSLLDVGEVYYKDSESSQAVDNKATPSPSLDMALETMMNGDEWWRQPEPSLSTWYDPTPSAPVAGASQTIMNGDEWRKRLERSQSALCDPRPMAPASPRSETLMNGGGWREYPEPAPVLVPPYRVQRPTLSSTDIFSSTTEYIQLPPLEQLNIAPVNHTRYYNPTPTQWASGVVDLAPIDPWSQWDAHYQRLLGVFGGQRQLANGYVGDWHYDWRGYSPWSTGAAQNGGWNWR